MDTKIFRLICLSMYFLWISVLHLVWVTGLVECLGAGYLDSPCTQPKVPGPCKGILHRFYFNSSQSKCVEFSYGGCEGNENRFHTVKECQDRCANNTNNVKNNVEEHGEDVVENGEQQLVGDILSIDEKEVITEKLDFTNGFKDWTAQHFQLIDTSLSVQLEGLHDIPSSPGDGNFVAVPEFSSSDTTIKGILQKQIHLEKGSRMEIDFYIYVHGFQENVKNKFLENNPSFQIKISSKDKNVTVYDLKNESGGVRNGVWRAWRIPVKWDKTEAVTLVMQAKMGNGLLSKVAIDDISVRRIPKAGQHLKHIKQINNSGSENVTSPDPSAAHVSTPSADVSFNVSNVSNDTGPQITDVDQGSSSKSTTSNSEEYENRTNFPLKKTSTVRTIITTINTTSQFMSNVSEAEVQVDSLNSGKPNLGWTSDIVLICLVVVFGISTIVLVLKYVHLKKHVGDFQIGSSRQTFDNPAYDTSNARYGPTHNNS